MTRRNCAVALLFLVVGCAMPASPATTSSLAPTSTGIRQPPTTIGKSTSTTTAAPGEAVPVTVSIIPRAPEGQFLVARSRQETKLYSYPSSGESFKAMPATTILGTPQVYLVEETSTDGWVELALPGRPHGATAWAPAADLDFEVVHQMIEVDLADRTLRYYRHNEEVFMTRAAVGSPSNPTPVGFFYVTDIVELADPASAWGPFALGLSARSDTITEFNGGDGIIGIHGTNRPSSIGEAVSLGCVRIENDLIIELAAQVELGTPVRIAG